MPEQTLKPGSMLPEFRTVTSSGDSISNATLKGRIVFIDFWASWCLACRKQNVNMVKLHDRIMAKSKSRNKFTLVSVSMDTRVDLWRIAIAKDELKWKTHICDFKGWESPMAKTFHITRIPSSFLVNEKGEIVAKDVWGKELDDVLLTLLP